MRRPITVQRGDCLRVLPGVRASSIDACVTDPPYGLGFMGQAWDGTGVAFQPETWRAVFRVLKPGAFLVAFGGTRTSHRLTCAIEDAGFEIRDCLSWLYGSGFPKSLNVGQGRGTALKPAWEPIILARKPFGSTVKANVRAHSTGALNIDACRIRFTGTQDQAAAAAAAAAAQRASHDQNAGRTVLGAFNNGPASLGPYLDRLDLGRWPANVLLDGDSAAALDAQAPFTGAAGARDNRGSHHGFAGGRRSLRDDNWGDPVDARAGASRFFYCAKASRRERDAGCDRLTVGAATGVHPGSVNTTSKSGVQQRLPRRNTHPTVKPVHLMRWLVRLVTPIGGLVLDPFAGSGSTGVACKAEARRGLLIEREAAYLPILRARVR